jgi:nicotinamide-nucleotide adenylyltransferase
MSPSRRFLSLTISTAYIRHPTATRLTSTGSSLISATFPLLAQVLFSRPIKCSFNQRMPSSLWRALTKLSCARSSCASSPARCRMTTLPLPSRPELERLIQSSISSSAPFQLVWTSNPSWPVPSDPSSAQTPGNAPSSTADPASTSVTSSSSLASRPQSPAHISVLDSSFNPPHLAHLGLALSHFPPPISSLSLPGPSTSISTHASSSDIGPEPLDHRGVEFHVEPGTVSGPGGYTSRLLLFSIRNADKTPSPGDATVLQRIEMTLLLAGRAERDGPLPGGTAVALINEPTFVGKSRIIHSFLSKRHSHSDVESASPSSITLSSTKPKPIAAAPTLAPAPRTTLSFLMGTDTLIRFFDPKYYPTGLTSALSRFFAPPPEGEGSILISARRGLGGEAQAIELDVLAREEVRGWVISGGVRVMGSAGEGREGISSTAIRRAVGGDGHEGDRAGERREEGAVRRLEGLVPREIAQYIEKEGLYRE